MADRGGREEGCWSPVRVDVISDFNRKVLHATRRGRIGFFHPINSWNGVNIEQVHCWRLGTKALRLAIFSTSPSKVAFRRNTLFYRSHSRNTMIIHALTVRRPLYKVTSRVHWTLSNDQPRRLVIHILISFRTPGVWPVREYKKRESILGNTRTEYNYSSPPSKQ